MKKRASIARRLGGYAALAAAGLPEGGILNPDKSLVYNIFIQLFNVAVLIAFLTFILYKPVRKFLADRRQRITDEIEEARVIKSEALQLKEKYEEMIKNIEAERENILAQTQKKAVEKSDQLLVEARREVEVINARAKAELESERENLSDDIKREIIDIAHLMASRFVRVSIDRETQDRLIEHAMAELDGGGGAAEAGDEFIQAWRQEDFSADNRDQVRQTAGASTAAGENKTASAAAPAIVPAAVPASPASADAPAIVPAAVPASSTAAVPGAVPVSSAVAAPGQSPRAASAIDPATASAATPAVPPPATDAHAAPAGHKQDRKDDAISEYPGWIDEEDKFE